MNIGRKIGIIGCWLLSSCLLGAQNKAPSIESASTQKVNFGIKAGFNSSMFIGAELKIKDVTIDEVQNNYKIGYFASLFVRFNLQRHFIQPELSYNISKAEIMFDKRGSQHPDIEPDYAFVESKLHSVDFPILYGYNVVKKGPYAMSLYGGPKFRYLWEKKSEITFVNFDQKGLHEELRPFNMSIVVGLGVNISRIFFDFRYEHGLRNLSRSITYDNINTDGSVSASSLLFKRRESSLNFSMGLIF